MVVLEQHLRLFKHISPSLELEPEEKGVWGLQICIPIAHNDRI